MFVFLSLFLFVYLPPVSPSASLLYLSHHQMFLAMSAGGVYFQGYLYAFHLLNIVNGNQLLSGVIKAVTHPGQWFVSR